MKQNITHPSAAQPCADETKRQFEAERRKAAEAAAKRFGELEGLLLAGLADGEEAEVRAAFRMAGGAIADLMPAIWRYNW